MDQTNVTSLADAGNPTDTGIPSAKSDGIATDPRDARTRRAIWKALLDLARKEGFHAVSVAQSARRAGIRYTGACVASVVKLARRADWQL
jgi:hypothetical protein